MKKTLILAAAATVAASLAPIAPAQAARDFINVVGSSTVYPFTTTVAEQFGRQGRFKTPKVESTGTGGGIKLFCNGVGPQHPDVVKSFPLTRKQVYLALAKQVPDPANPTTLIANPYKNWKDIDKSLPAVKIEVLGPPPTSGTRDSFHELYMETGCRTYPWINNLRNMDEKRFKRICHTLREDGAYIEAGENDNLIVQKLEANPNAVGIFGFSFLEENLDKLRGSKVESVEPDFDTIASGKYPASRPLFIYVKKAHIGVIPGLQEFVNEYVSDKALGEEGYLADRGLVPQPKSDLAKTRADVKSLKNFAP